LPTSETLGVKIEYLRELTIKLKVVYNVVLTSYISSKTLYGVFENTCMRFKKSSNLGVWSTVEAPRGRTVQIRNFIIEILIV